ncbi:sensor histidine kinase [Undibacterium pigrum]|uniref:Histidine kinase/DNA gyrase B/HSP90-like ATPase n=1 Tax=Undibacterium pigrum TaxID=401470 RepID=A0A318IKF6_9BURK|nr:histidine kinase [Undibacterium pigrum]PXX35323.1 histidine kinase/DNA gyrase B/HSP90-like ATPase [Undibacterium pigrum]
MRKDLTISHELKDSKASISWPLLPMLAVLGLLGYARFASAGSAWLADSLAILLAYTLAQTGLCLSQKTAWLTHASQRWVVLVVFMLLALLAGMWIEAMFWPPLTAIHAVWLLPAVLIVFIFATILPAAIDLEIRHRTQASLAAEASKHKMERQILEARLVALQGQIEPHFLFNTLANTRALIHQDAATAEQMLNHLIAYLRAAMPDMRLSTTTLGQELTRAAAYLQIFQIRLGPRFQFSVDGPDEVLACLIPPLAVMSLVENAIKHGIEPQPGDVRIDITASNKAGQLQITVSDNGRGFQGELGSGVGLLNVQERLLALFGEQAELQLQPRDSGGVSASIILPARTGELV